VDNLKTNAWRIITAQISDGLIEYQVSDGAVGDRSTSYDFDSLKEAQSYLHFLQSAGPHSFLTPKKFGS
jgi:hypothetical protein